MTKSNKPGNLITRALFLVVAGILAGAIFNALRPERGVPWVYPWSRHVEARALQEQIGIVRADEVRAATESGDYLILDARSADEYYEGAIPTAMSAPRADIDSVFPDLQLFLFPGQPVITYCSGLACDDALLLSLFLRDHGYTNVWLFPGGMEEWRAAGYRMEGSQ